MRKIYGLVNHYRFTANILHSRSGLCMAMSKAVTNFGHCVCCVCFAICFAFHLHSPLKVNEMWTGDGRYYEITVAINGNDGFIGSKD